MERTWVNRGLDRNRAGQVETALRVRMWWLTLFRGYRVVSRHRLPKQNVFGEIYYKDSWVLAKRD
jgi:GTP cyclohydrolase I